MRRPVWRPHLITNRSHNEWNDDCGHETRIIGNIAAPRDGESTVGIAYGASIYSVRYSVRVDDDVVARFDTWELREGIERAAENSDVVVKTPEGGLRVAA